MKHLATFLLLFSLSIFAIGCNKEDDTTTPTDPSTETETTEPANSEEG